MDFLVVIAAKVFESNDLKMLASKFEAMPQSGLELFDTSAEGSSGEEVAGRIVVVSAAVAVAAKPVLIESGGKIVEFEVWQGSEEGLSEGIDFDCTTGVWC